MSETKGTPAVLPEAEIDFEIDAEDLPDRAVRTELGPPSVIVDDVHVTYRVFGGKPVGTAGGSSLFNKLVGRTRQSVGAITQVRAVRGVSFVAYHGEAIGIVGTNGSGKSTLLRAVAGLHPPTQGRVYISGEPSLLGVNAALLKDLSGERNITIGGLALGMSQQEVAAKVQDIADFADLGDFVYLPMNAYSSGMAARLRFAISTIVTPDILMVDEALATGDAAFRKKSKERIEKIREEAGTVFLVSHSIASVRAMCTRVIWLDQGQVRMDGDVDTVCDAYQKFIQSKKGNAKAGGKIGPAGGRGKAKGRGGQGKPGQRKPGQGQGQGKAKPTVKVAGQHRQQARPADPARPTTGAIRKVAGPEVRPVTGSIRKVTPDDLRPVASPLREGSRPATGSIRRVTPDEARPSTGTIRKVARDDTAPSTGTLRRLTWEDTRPARRPFPEPDWGGVPETTPVMEPEPPRRPARPVASSSSNGTPDDGDAPRRRSWVGQRRGRTAEPAPETEAIPIVKLTDPPKGQGG